MFKTIWLTSISWKIGGWGSHCHSYCHGRSIRLGEITYSTSCSGKQAQWTAMGLILSRLAQLSTITYIVEREREIIKKTTGRMKRYEKGRRRAFRIPNQPIHCFVGALKQSPKNSSAGSTATPPNPGKKKRGNAMKFFRSKALLSCQILGQPKWVIPTS